MVPCYLLWMRAIARRTLREFVDGMAGHCDQQAIRFRTDQQGLTRKDLEAIIGPRNRVADILNRRRGLSVEMIRRLNAQLGISAEVLIRPSVTDDAA